jgi:hypothetical protein
VMIVRSSDDYGLEAVVDEAYRAAKQHDRGNGKATWSKSRRQTG